MCVCAYFACFKVLPDVVEVYEPVLSLVNSDIVSCSVVVMVMIPNVAHQQMVSHVWCLGRSFPRRPLALYLEPEEESRSPSEPILSPSLPLSTAVSLIVTRPLSPHADISLRVR